MPPSVINLAREIAMKLRGSILDIGRPATAAELATHAKLPLAIVSRRLQSNGASNIKPAFRWFARSAGLWTLTEMGLEAE